MTPDEEERGQNEGEPSESVSADEVSAEETVETVPRRKFLKYAAIGGAAAAVAGIGAAAWLTWKPTALPDYMPGPNLVDYSKVPNRIESATLKVAQWYDYWPGSFISNFQDYIFGKYGVHVDVIVEIYTSNEELFTWVTTTGKRFDVMFPTNYTVETMERAGHILNMNPDWLPDYDNLFDWTKYANPQNRYSTRQSDGTLLAVPYQWGTTGLGFRTDRFERADIEADGLEILWSDSYTSAAAGTFSLNRKKMMMDDMRETFGQTYKRLGWNEQVALGYTPTNIARNSAAPYNGVYQLSQNETEDARLNAARDSLSALRPSLYAFNTSNQGPYLVNEVVYIDTAWSGDIMYAIRPHTTTPKPVDYWVPPQGGARWIDNAVIGSSCRNLRLAHEFINFFLDADQGAHISDWNLYATPNAMSFDRLTVYDWYDPKEDPRIYADDAIGYDGLILERCEYQSDLGAAATERYLSAWNDVKFG
ncbi:MAG: hypothetical protein A3K68_01290 [Euryarchaeota archaeon RBG_16_68_13]|nr:MAG: hypothetical protein A3K68_01290 [Euryarchaeota archaeon RBG_16_68_13]